MANTLKLKRSATPAAVPTTGQLDLGEVAINTYDGKMYIKKDDGAAAIVEIGGGGGASALDDLTDVVISSPATDEVLKYNGTNWVNGAAAGGSSSNTYKEAVRAATTANIASLSGNVTLDGITTAPGDRILVKNQTTASQNGVYVAASGAWSRATDFDTTGAEVANGAIIPVQFGTVNGGSVWQLSQNGGTVGNSFRFAPIGGVAAYGQSAWTTPASSGVNSIAIGNGASAAGTRSVAIGPSSATTGQAVCISTVNAAVTAGSNIVAVIAGGATPVGLGTGSVIIGSVVGFNVTTGSNSVLIGTGSDAQGTRTVVIGDAAGDSGAAQENAVFIGYDVRVHNQVISSAQSVRNSTSIGYGARPVTPSEVAFGGGAFAGGTSLDAISTSIQRLWMTTTNATPTELGCGAVSTTPTSRIVLTNDSSYIFDCDIVARNTATDDESAMYNVKFGIRRGAAAANTALVGTPVLTVIGRDSGASAWDVSVTANTTNGRPNISVTGEASKTIRWVANIRMTKVTG